MQFCDADPIQDMNGHGILDVPTDFDLNSDGTGNGGNVPQITMSHHAALNNPTDDESVLSPVVRDLFYGTGIACESSAFPTVTSGSFITQFASCYTHGIGTVPLISPEVRITSLSSTLLPLVSGTVSQLNLSSPDTGTAPFDVTGSQKTDSTGRVFGIIVYTIFMIPTVGDTRRSLSKALSDWSRCRPQVTRGLSKLLRCWINKIIKSVFRS